MTKKEWDEQLRKIDEQHDLEESVTWAVYLFASVVVLVLWWQP